MSPHRRPGWRLPGGHLVRSQAEAALCAWLAGHDYAHLHWQGEFLLEVAPGALRTYIPTITLTGRLREGAVIVIEPIDSTAPGSGLRRLQAFRRAHGPAYCVALIARQPLHPHVPPAAYDVILPLEDFAPLLFFLRNLS